MLRFLKPATERSVALVVVDAEVRGQAPGGHRFERVATKLFGGKLS